MRLGPPQKAQDGVRCHNKHALEALRIVYRVGVNLGDTIIEG